jgi:hypothetical protein
MTPETKLSESLSEEQKKIIADNYLTLDIDSLSKMVWQDPAADRRSLRGRAVVEYMANMSLAPKRVRSRRGGPAVVLDQQQKEYIEEQLDNGLRPLDITRTLFQNPNIGPLSSEYRAVFAHLKTLDPQNLDRNEEIVDQKEYTSPRTFQQLIGLVNEYLPNGTGENLYKTDALKVYEEKCLRRLHGYMKAPAFGYQATQYERKVDRQLFESSFIRFCHDKPDLTAEEIHQYLNLSAEIVNTAQIERQIQRLDTKINNWLSGDDNDNEKKKMGMTMVELINAARGKWEAAKERQKKLLAELTESRSVRLKNRLDQNSSILNLVEAFQREKDRKELIEIAELEKKADMVEVDKLSNMDQVVALIAGMTRKELIH